MNIIDSVKRGKITHMTIITVLAILTIGVATAVYSNDPAFFNPRAETQIVDENPLMATLSDDEQDTLFRDQRLDEAQGVDNIVNNVLSGAVKPGRAIDRLVTIRLYARSDIDLSPEDTVTNLRYIDFVMSSQDVINSYMYKTGNVDEMRVLTKEKRDKI